MIAACALLPCAHLVLEDPLHRLLGVALQALVERGLDDHVLRGLAGEELGARGHHPVGEIPARPRFGSLGQFGGVGLCGARFGIVEISLFVHQADDRGGAALRTIEVICRRKTRGCHEQSGQHRGLGGVHIGGRLAEVALARRLETPRPGPEKGAVHVDREDLILAVFRLHRHGVDGFLSLALDRAAATVGFVVLLGLDGGVIWHTEAEQLCHLLRDRGAAMPRQGSSAFAEVDAHGAGDAPGADAEMPVESAGLPWR